MAGKLTDVGAAIALDAMTGRATQTARSTYLMLCTVAPTKSSTLASLAEYGATGTSRPLMAMGVPAGSPRVTSNTAQLTVGPFTAGTGTAITHWAEVSAATGTTGDVLSYGDFATPKTPGVGDSAVIPVGGITVSVD